MSTLPRGIPVVVVLVNDEEFWRIYGRNIWDWWTPQAGHISEAPEEAVAWRGDNPHATFKEHRLALYRITWAAASGDEPVVAVSVVSHVRLPSPVIMAAEVLK